MKTILLVDDDPDLLNILAETLSVSGHKVIPKIDAESALQFMQDGTKIDLVLTDLQLPGMGGSNFIRMLKSLYPLVPVIMLTGYGSVESYIETRSNGVFEYVNKPVQSKELRRIVKAALDWSMSESSTILL